ncbi:uroporphyrinogen-III C-methyltransferase [Roseburia hominis]
MSHTGKVWIAGAGPGDAELLTLKTEKLLKDADVIIYDALVSAEILGRIPEDKELIFVGKRLGNHAVPQWRINQILVEEAKKGKKVLRLKGGDPFVFGRGGEEAEALREHGILFEVVPGITSAVAALAYAGIPVTHRDYVSSFHVMTGHRGKDGTSRIDYETLAKIGGTLIFLMGLSSLEEICWRLVEAGMKPDTPAAVVSRGTTARQRKVVSDLAGLPGKVQNAGISMPALIVVGDVCRLSEEFEWTKERPLDGRQIVVTRPEENRGDLAERLKEAGAQVIEMPTIRIRPIEENQRLREELNTLRARLKYLPEENEKNREDGIEWLVFTSPTGVRIFFEQLGKWRMDIRQILGGPGKVCIAAIGRATADALGRYGIFDVAVPEKYCAKALGEFIAAQTRKWERYGISPTKWKNAKVEEQEVVPMDVKSRKMAGHVTILRAREGSKELLPPLIEADLEVTDVALYDTVYAAKSDLSARVQSLIERSEIDAVTFTSGSTVRGFVELLRVDDMADHLQDFQAICIGEQTEAEAKAYGMRTVTAPEATIEAMVRTLMELGES